MNYPFKLPGHPDLNLSLRTSHFSFARILKDGLPLEKVDGITFVPLADGTSLELKLKIGFDLTIPTIQFGRREIEVLPPLPVLWIIWAYIPMAMMFVGGAIGGACGGAAMALTLAALRMDLPRPFRYLVAILIPPIGFFAYWTLASLVLQLRQ